MEKSDIDILIDQIRYIILNRPIGKELIITNEKYADLQEAILYLADSIHEMDVFLSHLAKGEMNVDLPGRHNFMVGNIKDLHSSLLHLTWQTHQVALGDYNQKVSFLGEFSVAFNQMVEQLKERETKLKEQSEIMKKTNIQLKSIMDIIDEWIVVTEMENREVLYTNKVAHEQGIPKEGVCLCDTEYEELMQYMRDCKDDENNSIHEVSCKKTGAIYRVQSFPIYWDGKKAFVHFISDITSQKMAQKKLEVMSYKDELTGLYNRRFCLKILEELLEKKEDFSFCLVDLDGLKYVNDNFRHIEGDKYLKKLAHELKKVSRESDIVCRLGGDEFGLIFMQCSLPVAQDKMETVNQNLKNEKRDYPMRMSYGIVEISGNTVESVKEIIDLADKKMYTMKENHYDGKK